MADQDTYEHLWLDYETRLHDLLSELAAAQAEVERLTKEREAFETRIKKEACSIANAVIEINADDLESWKARAQSAEAELDAQMRRAEEWKSACSDAEKECDEAQAALAKLREAGRRLVNAASRLAVAAQTTGGVAGRDEGLCAEIDRIAQPLGALRALIEKEWE